MVSEPYKSHSEEHRSALFEKHFTHVGTATPLEWYGTRTHQSRCCMHRRQRCSTVVPPKPHPTPRAMPSTAVQTRRPGSCTSRPTRRQALLVVAQAEHPRWWCDAGKTELDCCLGPIQCDHAAVIPYPHHNFNKALWQWCTLERPTSRNGHNDVTGDRGDKTTQSALDSKCPQFNQQEIEAMLTQMADNMTPQYCMVALGSINIGVPRSNSTLKAVLLHTLNIEKRKFFISLTACISARRKVSSHKPMPTSSNGNKGKSLGRFWTSRTIVFPKACVTIEITPPGKGG